MKKIIYMFFILLFTFLHIGCSQQLPNVRVNNQSSDKANVQFKQPDNNTININDIASGAVSGFKQVVEGQIVVVAVVQNVNVSLSTTFTASNDNNYTIVIKSDNTMRVDIDEQ